MTRQILSIGALLAMLMTVTAYMTLDADQIAARLIALHGLQRAGELAAQGTGWAMLQLLPAQLRWVGPYLGAGAVTGLLARLAVQQWVKKTSFVEKVAEIVDEAGGRFEMHGVELAHAPYAPKWDVADVSDIPGVGEASTLEIELLGAYRAGGQPADVMDYHGNSLFDHCLGVWQRAVQEHGTCSLESLLALAHDAGKLMTFTKRPDGTWTRNSPRHEANNPEAIRRLPSFWSLPAEERDLVMRALHYMAGGIAAKDVSPEVVAAVQRVRVFDVRTTASETALPRQPGQVDLGAVMNALVAIAADPPLEWNVNRSQSDSTPAGAIHIGEGVLLVAGKHIRLALAAHLSQADAAALSLQIPTGEWHEAYDVIAEGIRRAGVGSRIVNNVASESGWFSVRVGSARIPHAIALKTSVPRARHELWGTNRLEIVLTETRKPKT